MFWPQKHYYRPQEEVKMIKGFLVRMKPELFERVKLLSKEYGLSINKMFIKIIEIGIIKMLGDGKYE